MTETSQISPTQSDEAYVVEGLRALARIITRTVLEQLPSLPDENRVENSLPPESQELSQTVVNRGLVTAEALSDTLSIPRSSIWRLAREGRIPCLRIGRQIRFDRDAVMGALRVSS